MSEKAKRNARFAMVFAGGLAFGVFLSKAQEDAVKKAKEEDERIFNPEGVRE